MLGLTAFLDWRGGQKTAQGIMWFGIGAIVGWPFAGALVIPLLLEEIIIAFIAGSMKTILYSIADGMLRCLLTLVGLHFDFRGKYPWCTNFLRE